MQGYVYFNNMRGLFIVIVVALIAIRYLFVSGFLPTHDGEYHIIRMYEFGRMLADGHIIPRWAPGLNSGYGVPLFIFFYPLPNYIGSLFHFFGWSLADSFRLTMAVGYMVAVVSCYVWLKRLYGIFPATVGSIVGAFVPYWSVDIFVRGSVGEVLALGFVFLALASISYERGILLAFAVAGLISSHNIMAMVFMPVVVLYAWIADRSMARYLLAGVLLASYFWIPALMERGAVIGLNVVNYTDHFPDLAQLFIPSWGTGFSGPGYEADEVSFQVGIIPTAMIFFGTAVFWHKKTFPELLFFAISVVALLLMQEISIPVWETIAFLKNLQYPWRLLSVIVVSIPLIVAAVTSRIGRPMVSAGIAIVAILFSFSYTKPVLYEPRSDAYYISRREFTDGTSSLGNSFSTAWMSWQKERPAQRMEMVNGEGIITMKKEEMTTFLGEITTRTGGSVRTNVAYYPGWRINVDGIESQAKPDEKGAISAVIGPGTHTVAVYFSRTPLRLAADLISLVGLAVLAWWGILHVLKSVVHTDHL